MMFDFLKRSKTVMSDGAVVIWLCKDRIVVKFPLTKEDAKSVERDAEDGIVKAELSIKWRNRNR